LFIIIVLAIWALATGAGRAPGVTPLNTIKVAALIVLGFFAGVLGGLIGTGGCSLMLPLFTSGWGIQPRLLSVPRSLR
jgi:hypothetical protein